MRTFLGQLLSVSPRFSRLQILTVGRSPCPSKWLCPRQPSSIFSVYLIPDYKQTLCKFDTTRTSRASARVIFVVVQLGSHIPFTVLRQRDLGVGPTTRMASLVKPQEQTKSGLVLQAGQLYFLAEVAISHNLPRCMLLFTPHHDGRVLEQQRVAGWVRGHVWSSARCWNPLVLSNLLHYHKPFFSRLLLLH